MGSIFSLGSSWVLSFSLPISDILKFHDAVSWCGLLLLKWAFHFSGSFQSGDSCPSIMGNFLKCFFLWFPGLHCLFPFLELLAFFWIIDPCRVILWFSFIYFCPLICFLEISLTLSSNLLNLYFTSHALNSESSSCHLLLFCSVLFINWIQCLLISLWRYYQYFLYNYWASLLALGKESACSAGDSGDPGVRNIPWRRKWLPSSILTWKIPWIEEPGSVQSKGSDMTEHTDLFVYSLLWWVLVAAQALL